MATWRFYLHAMLPLILLNYSAVGSSTAKGFARRRWWKSPACRHGRLNRPSVEIRRRRRNESLTLDQSLLTSSSAPPLLCEAQDSIGRALTRARWAKGGRDFCQTDFDFRAAAFVLE